MSGTCSPARFAIETAFSEGARLFELTCGPVTHSYRLADNGQNSYLDFFSATSRDFGCRAPLSRQPFKAPAPSVRLRPLLTRPVAPGILYGYGDPCVLRAPDPETGREVWWLLATSNDAPDAFPILRSETLEDWTLAGFVFPEGQTPPWALTGLDKADFWAPEMHRVGEEYWVCFTARGHDRELAIGIAKSRSPAGPFEAPMEPVLGGGVIDSHLLVRPGAAPLLFWKEDSNGVWPRLLADLLLGHDRLIDALFTTQADRCTAAVIAALWRWAVDFEPMEQFFVLQPLIEAVTEDFPGFEARLRALADREPALAPELCAALAAMKTRVYAQPLSADGLRLEGEPCLIVENDQDWEAHLIEGVWVSENAGRYYLFYSGNDFSTHQYAIGSAVADHPLGPYTKARPLLRSTTEWSGPGHPSVAPGPDGEPWLYLHAFFPGRVGYKAFRAVLTAKLRFGPDGLCLQ